MKNIFLWRNSKHNLFRESCFYTISFAEQQEQHKQSGGGGKGYYKHIQQQKGKKEVDGDKEWFQKRDARRDRVYLWQDRIIPYEFSPELSK